MLVISRVNGRDQRFGIKLGPALLTWQCKCRGIEIARSGHRAGGGVFSPACLLIFLHLLCSVALSLTWVVAGRSWPLREVEGGEAITQPLQGSVRSDEIRQDSVHI